MKHTFASAAGPSVLLATMLAFSGCQPDAALKKGEVIDNGTKVLSNRPGRSDSMGVTAESGATANPATLGAIVGVVHFSGAVPKRVPIDMSMDPGCATAGTNLSEQFVVDHDKLANVYVYVKNFASPSRIAPGAPAVVLDQKGCRYVPHVIALQQGGSVEFRNSDPTMHNVHLTPASGGNEAVDVSESPMGQPQVRQFGTPEQMIGVRCNNHPWMNAFINVANSPYFAVSSTDGSFTISGLPPGTYTLAAVHEKLGEQDMQISVPASTTAKADFTFSAK